MPVIDETIHTLEIKRIRKELTDAIERIEKRLSALESPKGK